MRVSVPDEPGSLGQLAAALGRGGANIVTLDVIDRVDGRAIDDLCVEAPDGVLDPLRRAVEEAPNAIVEAIRPLTSFRDVFAPMSLAGALAETPSAEVLGLLVERLPEALWASWCAAVTVVDGQTITIAASSSAPSLTNVETPWLPLDRVRRLDSALWMPPAWRMGRLGYEVAATPFGTDGALMVVRRHGPRFRSSELRQLGLLVQMARVLETRTGTSHSTNERWGKPDMVMG
jgi:hypothetical protein